ncbi:PspC domain-containing protein [Leucobacter coleopterorum]|uniref:PspC domain-containing protein n=1 Tax=Leucobacter coleopterorum TaxID=2714933 RepID=A0ABX6JUM1_9MICO|nr:PspC domain-containing protein [Leucobacter coleopterorum]
MNTTPDPDPQSPPQPTGGFFAWIRGLGIARGSDRWFAGVAGGIAAKAGIDPLIVRGIFVVLALLGGPGILLYLAGWLLLPDFSGRIRLEDLFRGRAEGWTIVAVVVVALMAIPALLNLFTPSAFGWALAPGACLVYPVGCQEQSPGSSGSPLSYLRQSGSREPFVLGVPSTSHESKLPNSSRDTQTQAPLEAPIILPAPPRHLKRTQDQRQPTPNVRRTRLTQRTQPAVPHNSNGRQTQRDAVPLGQQAPARRSASRPVTGARISARKLTPGARISAKRPMPGAKILANAQTTGARGMRSSTRPESWEPRTLHSPSHSHYSPVGSPHSGQTASVVSYRPLAASLSRRSSQHSRF